MYRWKKIIELPTNNLMFIFLFILVLSVLSKGGALFDFGYAVDTYSHFFNQDFSSTQTLVLSQGRFGHVVLYWLLYSLGIQGPYPYILGVCLAYIALGMLAFTLCRPFLTEHTKISASALLGMTIVLTHPYFSEIFTFREALLYFSVATIFGVSGYNIVNHTKKRLVLGALMIALGLSLYQLFINYLFIILSFSVLVSIRIEEQEKRSESLALEWKRAQAIFLGVVFYFILFKTINWIVGVNESSRVAFIGLADVPERFLMVCHTIIKIFDDDRLSGQYYIYWFGTIIVLSVFSLAGLKNKRMIFPSVFVFLFSIFSVVGILAVNKTYWAVPRTLSAAPLFIAGCVGYAIYFSSKSTVKFIAVICALAAFGYAGISNKIFVDQQRLNERDRLTANRIVSRMEMLPDFSDIRRVAAVGIRWGYPSAFETNYGDLNMSAFGTPWSNINLLRDASGYNFLRPTSSDMEAAEKYCEMAMQWPSSQSITKKGDLGIVCLKQ